MTKKLQSKKSGFTLVELIVVIAILGILAAITIPRFSQYVQNAKDTALDANAKTVYNALAAAETKIIADNAKPNATAVTLDATNIVKEAKKSLSGVDLVATADADTKDNSFGLAEYTVGTSTAPSSFTIDNLTADNKSYQWANGGARTDKAAEVPPKVVD